MKWLTGIKSSLRKQIIVTSLLCLVVPVGGIILISSLFTLNLIKDRVVIAASESLQVTQAHITQVMDDLIKITNNIQFDQELRSILRDPAPQGNRAIEMQLKVTEKLEALTSENPGIYITLLLPDERFYTNYNTYYDYNPLLFKSESWFPYLEYMDTFETYWVGVQPTYIESKREQNPYVVTIARTLKDNSSKPYAYVIVSVNESQIRFIITKYSESQNIMLLSSEGKIISGLERIGESYPNFAEIRESDDSTMLTIGEEEQIMVKRNLYFADWMLVSLTSYKKAASPIYTIFRSNFLLEIGFVILFLMILIYLLRQLTKPILHLVQIATSIEAGNLSIRSNLKGPYEFVKLGRSFDHMLDSIESMLQQITYEQEKKRKAELAMLQAQIKPHFLFNILNAIRLRIMLRGDREHADIISSLLHLLRQTISNHEYVSLQDEVYLVEEYMKLMRFTSKHPFQYEVELSSETLLEMVPRFILQPIIENAIIHGLSQQEGLIRIRAWKEQEQLLIVIEDDGVGMSTNKLAELRNKLQSGFESGNRQIDQQDGMSGIGLINIYERLKMVYGERFRLVIESKQEQGTVVKLYIDVGERYADVEGADRR